MLSSHDKILENTVVEIFDHRTINNEEICKSDKLEKTVIKIVGSCCTLIANEIIESKVPVLFTELSNLLYGKKIQFCFVFCYSVVATIVYDTIGLDQEAGKTFQDDLKASEYLENILKPTQTRTELFQLLWKIHNDTSSLSSLDLLYRDLKVVKGVPIPGLPMLVEDYLKREDVDNVIANYARELKASSVVLMGIDASNGVKRDLAIYSTDPAFKHTLIAILKDSKQMSGSDLELTGVSVKHKDIICFKQGNIKLSRKFILPLVNEAAVRSQK